MRVKQKEENKDLKEEIAVEKKMMDAINKKTSNCKPGLSSFVKLYTDHHAFINNLEYILEKDPGRISEFIINNWKRVFPTKPFPSKGGTLQMLKVCIQYGYIMRAHKKHNIRQTGRFMDNYRKALDLDRVDEPVKLSILDKCEKYNKLSQTFIKPLQGDTKMGKEESERKPATKKNKDAVIPEIKEAKESERKPVAEEKKAVVDVKAGKETKITKCLNLLLKRKYDDNDILEMSGLTRKDLVQWYRMRLNRGDFEEQGYPIPTPKVEKIGGVTVSKGRVVQAVAKKEK